VSLEDAWVNKVTRFPVDAERFVDTVKMMQRRLDMTGKARKVKREPQLALQKYVFNCAGPLRSNVGPKISQNGGIVTHYITSKVSYVVCDQPGSVPEQLEEAKELKIPIISSDGVYELITNRAKANLKPHIVDVNSARLVAPPAGAVGIQKAGIPASSAKKSAVNGAAKIIMPKPIGLPWKNGYARPLDISTQWMGALSMPGSNHGEALQLDVTHFSSTGEWGGILTNFASKTSLQIEGILIPGGGPPMQNGELSHTIYMHASHIISGDDKRLDKFVRKGHLDICSRTIKLDLLSLTYIRHVPLVPLAFLQPGTTWNGSSATETAPIKLDITKTISPNQFEGSITWPELDVKTSCLGRFAADGQIHFEETGIITAPDNDFDMPPTKYFCRPVPTLTTQEKVSAIRGSWSATSDGVTTRGVVALQNVSVE
jgi:hypothetical protein